MQAEGIRAIYVCTYGWMDICIRNRGIQNLEKSLNGRLEDKMLCQR